MGARSKSGSVAQDHRSKTWNFFWWENGKRKCKVLGRFPTKAAAWQAAKPMRDALEETKPLAQTSTVSTVNRLVGQYREEKMPQRFSARYAYNQWLVNHIFPKLGEGWITDLRVLSNCGCILSHGLPRALCIYGVLFSSSGNLRCGAVTYQLNGTQWNWSRSKARRRGRDNRAV